MGTEVELPREYPMSGAISRKIIFNDAFNAEKPELPPPHTMEYPIHCFQLTQ